jgi:hypothetical protein
MSLCPGVAHDRAAAGDAHTATKAAAEITAATAVPALIRNAPNFDASITPISFDSL